MFLNNVLLFIGKWERVFRHAIPDPDNAEAFSGAAGELLSKNEEDPRANLYSRYVVMTRGLRNRKEVY